MPLPAAVGTVTIAFDIRHPASGTPGTGTVEVTVPYALRDTTDHVILGPGTIPAAVDNGVGQVTIPDPNDSDVSPQGWAPHIKVLTDVWAAEFDVVIPPGSGGTTLQLSNLAPAENPPALVSYALASDLNNYLPKVGGTITGPITWNGTPNASGHLATKAYVDANAGGGSTPDATTITKGKLQLAGDLAGTADAPTVPALATKYVKPGSGIPSSDLTAAVQTSLGKADTASQPGHTHTASQVTDFITAVDARVQLIVDAAPAALDTLNELAAALNDDPNFAATVTTALAGKQPLDADLTAIAALAPADGALLQRIAGVWATVAATALPVSTDQQAAINARIPASIVDAKGDIIAASAADTVVRVAVGTDGQVLTADAASSAGVKWATPSGGGGGGTLKAYATTGTIVGTFGPCGIAGSWTVCPTAFRAPAIAAAVGDILDWRPNVILGVGTATSDAEFDLATIDNSNTAAPIILRCLSSGTNTPLTNGFGGMYCWQNNARRLPGCEDWQVTSDDLVSGTVTFALLYRANASGLAIGHASVYPSRISVLNHGPTA